MSKASDIAEVIRSSMLEQAEALLGLPAVVALSGGVDSCACLAALMEVGHNDITIVSYTPSTHESTDFKMAKATASNLDLPFEEAIVPMNVDYLDKQLRRVVAHGYKKKVQIESLVPMLDIAAVAAEYAPGSVLLTGDQSDGYFALSRFASVASDKRTGYDNGGDYSDIVRKDTTPERIDEIRRWYYEHDASCSGAVAVLCQEVGLGTSFPFRDRRIFDAFTGTTWRQVNKPRVKEPIKLAWTDWFHKDWIQVRNVQVNLHKGDSGFGNTMGEMLLEKYEGFNSAIGLYNAIVRGEV